MSVTLADLITPARVVVGMHAPTLSDAAEALLPRLAASGEVQDAEKLRRRVEEERGEDIVALGDRAFLMHYRTDAVQELLVAVGTSAAPVHRSMGDNESQTARIVLLIVAPPRLAARYLQVLGAFSRALSNARVVEALLAAGSADALATLPALREYALPEHLAVRDIMTDRPHTTTPETPLRDAALMMARGGIGALPVVEADGLLVGMLSERELTRHLLSSYLQGPTPPRPAEAGRSVRRSVRDVMTRQVLCISPEQPLAEVAALMTNKDVGGVPVVAEGRVVGFLTRGDIIRKLIGS